VRGKRFSPRIESFESRLLMSVASHVAKAPAIVQPIMKPDNLVGPPPAYTGYPGIYTLNPNYPYGGYVPVYAGGPGIWVSPVSTTPLA
jgi:hypothetical protein